MLYSDQNIASIRLFKKVGFLHTATLKEWVSLQHTYVEVIVMQKFNTKRNQ